MTGETISDGTAFFHAKPEFYSHAVPMIRDAGIQIIDYRWFNGKLKQIVKGMKQEYSDVIEAMRPRVTSLDYILALDNELVYNPFLLMRESNTERRLWTRELLRNLTNKAKEVRNVS